MQIAVFAVIAVIGIVYAGGSYAGLGRLFGVHGYVVKLELVDSGGIFTNAEVSYRGVTVGRVGELRLTSAGVEVDLDIDPSAPPIPANAKAIVADRSAVGEQYVDLEPIDDSGPMLADGSVIPQERTSVPVAPQTLLTDLDQLATSVPTNSLRTVVDELGTAFNGAGPGLAKLLDAADAFTRTAIRYTPQTINLFSTGRTVLATQQAEAAQITSFSAGLNQLAAQLQRSDPDIRTLIDALPATAQQVDTIIRSVGNDLGVVTANLLTTARITETRTAAITETLVEFPVAVAAAPSADPDGTGHLGFVLDFFDPMPCTKGYQGTNERSGGDTSAAPVNTAAYCAEPASTGIDVRGSNNAPFGGVPAVVAAPTATANGTVAGSGGAGPRLPGALGYLGGNADPMSLAGLLGISAARPSQP